MPKEIKRIDEAVVARVLMRSTGTLAEVILRFAWHAGLSAGEMQGVRWQDVSFEPAQITLPDRVVPMEEPLLRCLQQRQEKMEAAPAEYILASGPCRTQLHRVSISRLAREALDAEGLTEIHLTDLRNGYVLRRLKAHDWPDVARVSGLSLTTLRRNFAACVEGAAESPLAGTAVTEESLRQLIEREGTSTVGLAVALSWRAGLRGTELAALTWSNIDFGAACIHLPDRNEPMDTLLEQLLRQAHEERGPQQNEPVLLTPKTGRAMSDGHLSRMVRHALIRSGMEHLTLGKLVKMHREGSEAPLLARAQEKGGVTRNEAMEMLRVAEHTALRRLNKLVEEGRLVKVGQQYHIPGTVVPPQEHYSTIRGYLKEHGGAYRQDLAQLLGLEPRVCGWILHNLVEEGRLNMDRQWYTLPLETDET